MSTVFAINVKMLLVAIANALPVLKRAQKDAHRPLSQIEVTVKNGFLLLTTTDRFVIVKTKVPYSGDGELPESKFYLSIDEVTALKTFKNMPIIYRDGQLHIESLGLSFGSEEPPLGDFPHLELLWDKHLNDFPHAGENTEGSHTGIEYIKHIKKVLIYPRAPRNAWLFVTEDKNTCGMLMPKMPHNGIAAELREAGF